LWIPLKNLCLFSGYPSAVHNTRHVGICIAQLVGRIRETGNEDIHLIGFSLGGQICNYVANKLREDNYQLPRITGLGLNHL
jgi:triacylglycerol esterase/lipase EstA (alpha/beta hydrolase family)